MICYLNNSKACKNFKLAIFNVMLKGKKYKSEIDRKIKGNENKNNKFKLPANKIEVKFLLTQQTTFIGFCVPNIKKHASTLPKRTY